MSTPEGLQNVRNNIDKLFYNPLARKYIRMSVSDELLKRTFNGPYALCFRHEN